jgi:hypothetical protein
MGLVKRKIVTTAAGAPVARPAARRSRIGGLPADGDVMARIRLVRAGIPSRRVQEAADALGWSKEQLYNALGIARDRRRRSVELAGRAAALHVRLAPAAHVGWDAEPAGRVSINWGDAWARGAARRCSPRCHRSSCRRRPTCSSTRRTPTTHVSPSGECGAGRTTTGCGSAIRGSWRYDPRVTGCPHQPRRRRRSSAAA